MILIFAKLIFFLLITPFLFYFPGRLVKNLSIRGKKLDFVEDLTLNFGLGISLFTYLCFILYFLRLRFLLLPAIFVLNFLSLGRLPVNASKFGKNFLTKEVIVLLQRLQAAFRRNRRRPAPERCGVAQPRRKTPQASWLGGSLLFVILLGVLAQTSFIFPSLTPTKDGDLFFLIPPFSDTIWHISVIEQMQANFPPLHPYFSSHILKNYHYFYDLTLAGVNTIFPFLDSFDLYCQLVPIILSALYGLSCFIFGRKLAKNNTVGLLSAFLGYFASSLAYLIPFIPGIKPNTVWHESSFWMIQPLSTLVNPTTAVSFIPLILGLFSFSQGWRMLTVIFWASIIGFKVYAGILVIASLSLIFTWRVLKKGNFSLAKILLPIIFISGLIFLPMTSGAEKSLYFAPGLFLRKMVEDPDRVPIPKLILLEEHYKMTSNWVRILQLRLYQLAIFTLGNFGTRIILIIPILAFIWQKGKKSQIFQFMLILGIIGFALPHLFFQTIDYVNSIQFSYYSLIVLTFLAACAIDKICLKLKRTSLKITFIFFILLISSLTSFKEILRQLQRVSVASKERQNLFEKDKAYQISYALSFLKKQKPGVTLVQSNDVFTPSFAKKQTYFSSPNITHKTGVDVKEKEAKLLWFLTQENQVEKKREFLRQENINYIFLPISYLEKQNWQKFGSLIFKNSQYFIVRLSSS